MMTLQQKQLGSQTLIAVERYSLSYPPIGHSDWRLQYDLEADFPSLPQQPRSAPVESSSQLQEPVGSSGEREEESEPEASDKESADGRDEGEPVEEGFSADNIANVSPTDEYAEYLKRQEAEQQVRKRQVSDIMHDIMHTPNKFLSGKASSAGS